MTRSKLYALVWSKPMIHLAKEFGLSDVGFRKICVKHDIPTPRRGHRAKLAHGKFVDQIPLPPTRESIDEAFHLVPRPTKVLPPRIEQVQAVAEDEQAAPENAIIVPDERPVTLHPIASAVEKALRKAKPDERGFLTIKGESLPDVVVGRQSEKRAVLILDTFLEAATALGFLVTKNDEGFGLRRTRGSYCPRALLLGRRIAWCIEAR